MADLERLRPADGPVEVSLAVRGPAGAVEYFPDAPASLQWHRPEASGAGTPCACPLVEGTHLEESAGASWLAASVAAAGGDDETVWQWLERLYWRMAAEAAGRRDDRG